ncbi:MAG: putative bifunctional diguanylate cyclase/phosphodiesterase [Leptothrix sp. (in: b-proteobacteria)]
MLDSERLHASDNTQVVARLLDKHFRQSLQASISGVVLALVVGAVLWSSVPSWALLTWLLVVESAGVFRSASTLLYLRGHLIDLAPSRWVLIVRAGTVLSGIGWGGLGLLYGLSPNPIHQLVIVFTLMGVCAGSATLVVSLAGTVQLFGVLALGPLIGVMLGHGDAAHIYLGAALTYYLWVVMFQGPRRVATSFNDLIAGTREREELLRRLEDAEQMAHVAHFIWDHVQRKATLSSGALRLYGVRPDTPMDAGTLWEAVVPRDRHRVMALSGEATRRGDKEVHFETSIQLASGTRDVQVVQRFEYSDGTGKLQRTMTTLLDITELKTTQRELHAMAFRDTLTGLANRALFQDRLRKIVARAQRQQQGVGVLMLDLDHFKTVNDTLGHSAGDQLLIEAAQRLQGCVRSYDTVARLGGDEFAVVLPDVRQAIDVATVAGKIILAMSAPFRLGENELFVSASIGIAVCPGDADSADLLMRHADIALFEAKAKGRANFQFYSADLTLRAQERLGLEADLRRALPRGELSLHYQPKIRIEDGRVTGAEALLRWMQPERGMVAPDRFIGIAEDSGLIVPIGSWVLRESCRTACAWNRTRHPADILKIAVNLSPRQFMNHDLVADVRAALQETGCQPAWIELELTESLLLDERGKVQEVLQELRALGFTLAIDDFGTGYSALGYLTRFPLTTLKIDRSFTQDITTKPDRAGIVRAIVSMGHSLQLELVAEGVETREQADFLNGLGCHLAQGWLYGKPLPRHDFEQRHISPIKVLEPTA